MPRKHVLNANRQSIMPAFFQMADIDPEKVASLVRHLEKGGLVPPVVVAAYKNKKCMPLDGHHRLQAHFVLERMIDAWVVSGQKFDALCMRHRRAEDYVLCDGIPCMEVAERWNANHHADS